MFYIYLEKRKLRRLSSEWKGRCYNQLVLLIRVKRLVIQDRGWFGQAVIAEECAWKASAGVAMRPVKCASLRGAE